MTQFPCDSHKFVVASSIHRPSFCALSPFCSALPIHVTHYYEQDKKDIVHQSEITNDNKMKCAFNGFLLLMDHKLFIWLVGPLLYCHLTGYSIAHRTRFLTSIFTTNSLTTSVSQRITSHSIQQSIHPPADHLRHRVASIVLTLDGFIVFCIGI